MQDLEFAAEPKSDNPESDEFGGAIVGCWIKDRTKEEARECASVWIEDDGWIPRRLEKHLQVQPTELEENSKAKKDCDQAMIEGQVMNFFTYPKGATE